MKRITIALFASALLAGCGSGGTSRTKYDRDIRGRAQAVTIDTPSGGMPMSTHELGTDRTRGRAKTIEWAKISTTAGTRYLGGAVVVDRIIRSDAEDIYGVEVRLKNVNDRRISFQVRIYFIDEEGNYILGVKSRGFDTRVDEDWKTVAIEGLGLHSVTDSARMRGAVGFDLRIRASGTDGEGRPDAGVGSRDAKALKRELEKK